MSGRETGKGLDRQWRDSVLENVRVPTADEEQRARRVLAGNAADAGECAEWLQMLGLMPAASTPGATICAGTCGRPLRGQRANVSEHPGTARVYAKGMCAPCWKAAGKPRQQTREPVTVTTHGVPCAGGCGRRLRSRHDPQWPGTTLRIGRDRCTSCYHRDRAALEAAGAAS